MANVPHNAHTDFLYADRRAGGLGATRLSEDADVWTIARAAQLLDSSDTVVSSVARAQASKNIYNALKIEPTTALLSDYLSGSQTGGLYDIRFASTGANTWSRARRAAKRLRVRIDVSGDNTKTHWLLTTSPQPRSRQSGASVPSSAAVTHQTSAQHPIRESWPKDSCSS